MNALIGWLQLIWDSIQRWWHHRHAADLDRRLADWDDLFHHPAVNEAERIVYAAYIDTHRRQP